MVATKEQLRCEHTSFQVTGCVGRLSEKAGGPVVAYTLDVTVECANCRLPFRFIGGKPGSSPHEPRVSVDGLEMRVPIEPAIVDEIFGRPLVAGRG